MDESVKNGLVFELGGGKDGLMYPASGTAPALVLDASSNSNNGVNSGAVLVTDHLGNSDGALLIDANNERVEVLNNPFTSFYGASGKGTISVRFKFVAEARSRYIIAKSTFNNEELYLYFTPANSFTTYFGSANLTPWLGYSIPTTNFIDNNFYHLVLVYDNTQPLATKIKGYLNNVLLNINCIQSGSYESISATTAKTVIGNYERSSYANAYGSAICDFAIHSKGLSESETSTLYNGGTVIDGLVLDLPMNRLNCRTNSGIDTAGNNVITNNGATLTADHNGRANRAWELSTTKYLEMASAMNQLSIANPFTILIAIQSNLTADNSYWLVNYINANNKLSLYQTGNSFRFGVSDGITSYRKSSTMTNGWHFLAITWDLTTFSVKQNNSINWTNADGVSYPTTPFRISGDGKMDYLFIANRVLSASEIQKLYNYWSSH